jgi:hypothetical protein
MKMPHQRQPVPPIFQPEVAADAIVFAAEHPRREVVVGWPTVKAILSNAVAPGIADRYLADNGYQAQQTDLPLEHDGTVNLFEPAAGDQGAHGRSTTARSGSRSSSGRPRTAELGRTIFGRTAG